MNEFLGGFFGCSLVDPFMLELDFGPFNARFPRLKIPKSIGNGVQFLNRHLSSHLFNNPESMVPMFEFLRTHRYRGEVKISAFFILALHPPPSFSYGRSHIKGTS
jgi:hypothetical protein